MDLTFTLTILAAALATYGTRTAGYALIKSLETIPPRMEAALNAVPAAVLTALVAPSFVYGGIDVTLTLILALLIGLRAKSLVMLGCAWAFVVACPAAALTLSSTSISPPASKFAAPVTASCQPESGRTTRAVGR